MSGNPYATLVITKRDLKNKNKKHSFEYDGTLISDPVQPYEKYDSEGEEDKFTVIKWRDREDEFKVRLRVKEVRKGKQTHPDGSVTECTHLALFVRETLPDGTPGKEVFYTQVTLPEWKPEFQLVKAVDIVLNNESQEE